MNMEHVAQLVPNSDCLLQLVSLHCAPSYINTRTLKITITYYTNCMMTVAATATPFQTITPTMSMTSLHWEVIFHLANQG